MTLNLEEMERKLCETLCQKVQLEKRLDGQLMLRTGFEFPDGDRFPIYVEETKLGGLRLSDWGHTLMHISYDHDIDAFMKGSTGALMEQIVREAGLDQDGGVFSLDTDDERLPDAIFRFGQALTRIYDLRFLSRSGVSRSGVESTFHDEFRFPTRSLSLRRGSQVPLPLGASYDLPLSALGLAAVRETFLTDTREMAGLWTGMFSRSLTASGELRWRDNGLGIGGDARNAYSGLLGRFMARAYLTEEEEVLVLIPLDEAKRRLKHSSWSLKKLPQTSGSQADWIGRDENGYVIAEAKGTYRGSEEGWSTGHPKALKKAIDQTKNTVMHHISGKHFPARRWAIASQWATEHNKLTPKILAWDLQGQDIDNRERSRLDKILFQADISAILHGLGYSSTIEREEDGLWRLIYRLSNAGSGTTSIHVGDKHFEPGFVAVVGTNGIRPLSGIEEITGRNGIVSDNSVVLISLSCRYVWEVMGGENKWEKPDSGPHWASQAGLTIVWANAHDEIRIIPNESG